MNKINKLTPDERSFLVHAYAILGQTESLRILATNYEVDITLSSPKTAKNILHVGIQENWPEIIRFGLCFPQLLDQRDVFGSTPRQLFKAMLRDDECLRPVHELEAFSNACGSGDVNRVKGFLMGNMPIPICRMRRA